MLGRWLSFILWLVLIFTTSIISVPNSFAGIFSFQDKLIHFVVFGVLGIFLARAIHQEGPLGRARFWACIAGAALYGAFIEFYQSFLPDRSAQWSDFAANCFGAFAFVWAWLAVRGQRLFTSSSPKNYMIEHIQTRIGP